MCVYHQCKCGANVLIRLYTTVMMCTQRSGIDKEDKSKYQPKLESGKAKVNLNLENQVMFSVRSFKLNEKKVKKWHVRIHFYRSLLVPLKRALNDGKIKSPLRHVIFHCNLIIKCFRRTETKLQIVKSSSDAMSAQSEHTYIHTHAIHFNHNKKQQQHHHHHHCRCA